MYVHVSKIILEMCLSEYVAFGDTHARLCGSLGNLANNSLYEHNRQNSEGWNTDSQQVDTTAMGGVQHIYKS